MIDSSKIASMRLVFATLLAGLVAFSFAANARADEGASGRPADPYALTQQEIENGAKTDDQVKITSDPSKPYKISDDGQVDKKTLIGYKRYHEACHVCHGPNALGSSFAPALATSLKTMSEEDFFNVVVNGRTEEQGAARGNVMPSFGDSPNVMPYIDGLYAYIKARADAVIGPGRPNSYGEKKLVIK